MNPQETAELTELIRRIKDEFKITIMLIEHDMNLFAESLSVSMFLNMVGWLLMGLRMRSEQQTRYRSLSGGEA